MKKLFCIIMIAALLLPLAACAGKGGQEAAPNAEAARDPYEDYNNHYMRWLGPPIPWAETEDYLFFNRKYLDKNTGDCGYYCSKPECMHNDPTCDSYLTVLGIYDDEIYLFGSVDKQHAGIFTQNIDGSDRKLVRKLGNDELGNGGVHLHRGKVYMFFENLTVNNGEPTETLRLTCVDPFSEETRVLLDNRKYPGSTGSWVFFRGNTAYLLTSGYAPEDAEEHPGCCIWELWSYDIEKDEMELTLTSFLPEGSLRGCWITGEGEIYAMVCKTIEAERPEDWQWSFSLAKLEDGVFTELWEVPPEKELGNSRVSDGTVITEYADAFRYNKDVRFRIQDLDGNIIADDRLPFPNYGEGAKDLTFDRYEVVWADKTCLWVLIRMERPIINSDGYQTTQSVASAVKYDITDGGYAISFVEPVGLQ